MRISFLILILLIICETIVLLFLFRKKIGYPNLFYKSVNSERIKNLFNKRAVTHFSEPKPNSVNNEVRPDWIKEKLLITINSDSLNEDENYSIKKEKDTFRIIALGDSFTYGYNVSTKDNYPEQLEKYLNSNKCPKYKKFEVINLGMSGEDLFYMNVRFQRRGKKYNPDLIIIFAKADDLIEPTEFIIDGIHQNPNSKIPIEKRWIEAFNEAKSIIGQKNIINYEMGALQEVRNNFKDKILILTNNRHNIDGHDFLAEFANQPNTAIHYTPTVLATSKYSQPDRHPNKYGYKLIAQDLSKFLLSTIISCTTGL